MLNNVADKIEQLLEELNVFKAVEQSISKKILSAPPSAAFFLAYNRKETDKPSVMRRLGWDIVLLVPAAGRDRGMKTSWDCIDAVQAAFTNWQPFPAGGCLPVEAPEIVLEGMQNTLLVYTVRVVMRVMPDIIDKE